MEFSLMTSMCSLASAFRSVLLLFFVVFAPWTAMAESTNSTPEPFWIWLNQHEGNQAIYFRKEFSLDDEVNKATVYATADNHCEVFINGARVTKSDAWEKVEIGDAKKHLKKGRNVIGVIARNDGGAAGFILSLQTELKNKAAHTIESDSSWRVAAQANDSWRNVGFDDSKWNLLKLLASLVIPSSLGAGKSTSVVLGARLRQLPTFRSFRSLRSMLRFPKASRSKPFLKFPNQWDLGSA